MTSKVALYAGPILFVVAVLLNPFGLGFSAAALIGIVGWMLIWWISEVVHMAVTALLPLVLFPLMGILSVEETSQAYGDRMVFLFLGGFLIALSMEKWGLHRRIALMIIHLFGSSANRIVFGFLSACFLISMWISNTATALMMFPIATSVVNLILADPEYGTEKDRRNFSTSIMLSIAYGSSIGGIATVIGSPPNGAMKAYLESNHDITVSFFDWMKLGFPFALVLMLIGYFVLTRLVFPNKLGKMEQGGELIDVELKKLGPWSFPEKATFVVFLVAALLWMSQDLIIKVFPSFKLTDVGIAIFCGISLFLIPGRQEDKKNVLEWKDTKNLHWGVLLMFGGGLSLAKAFKPSGLLDLLKDKMEFLSQLDLLPFLIILCLMGLILTALMSNLAMVNIFVPVVAVLALAAGKSPELFAIPVTIAASCDFMFPMSTPPNAIAYSSGWVRAKHMFQAGIILNILSFGLLSVMVWLMLKM
jgi:sodium-dependent dicarboxylate transporter 2/3/5